MNTIPSLHLAGRWVGEMQGCDSPAHIWEIEQQGDRLIIRTRWENSHSETRLYGKLVAGANAFTIGSVHAVVLGPLHFVVPGCDTSDIRGGVGPAWPNLPPARRMRAGGRGRNEAWRAGTE
jgi:hypothetical protein